MALCIYITYVNMLMTMSEQPKCNMCGYPISWDQTSRNSFNIKGPVTPDHTAPHACPRDADKKILVKPGEEAFVKQKYDEYMAKKGGNQPSPNTAGSQGTLSTPPSGEPNNNQQAGSAVTAVLNSKDVDTGIKVAIAELVRKVEDMREEFKTEMAGLDNFTSRAGESYDRLEKKIDEFIRYNPSERAVLQMVEKLMSYLPEPLSEPKALGGEQQ